MIPLRKLFQLKHDESPILMLAPMADLAGWAFREFIRRTGGCHVLYSEMLNTRRVPGENKHSPIFFGFDQEKDLMIQLLGNDANLVTSSIARLETLFDPMGYDLNMGCSRTAIMRHGWGAAMLQQLLPSSRVLAAMRKQTEKPLTVKIRFAWERWQDAAVFVKMIEDQGMDAVIVHARTPEKIFTRPAKWEWIQQIKAVLKIPVIGNGDVVTPEDAHRMLAQTQCDGIMIGRGAVADPDIFNHIIGHEFHCGKKQEIFKRFIELLDRNRSDSKKKAELRKFCEYFSEGLPVPHWFWGKIQGIDDSERMIQVAQDYLIQKNL